MLADCPPVLNLLLSRQCPLFKVKPPVKFITEQAFVMLGLISRTNYPIDQIALLYPRQLPPPPRFRCFSVAFAMVPPSW